MACGTTLFLIHASDYSFSGLLVNSFYFTWPLNIRIFCGSALAHSSKFKLWKYYNDSQNYNPSTHLLLSLQIQMWTDSFFKLPPGRCPTSINSVGSRQSPVLFPHPMLLLCSSLLAPSSLANIGIVLDPPASLGLLSPGYWWPSFLMSPEYLFPLPLACLSSCPYLTNTPALFSPTCQCSVMVGFIKGWSNEVIVSSLCSFLWPGR